MSKLSAAWCGTITPIQLPNAVVTMIRKIGEFLGPTVGLRGLLGCDFLIDRDQAWLTEVNPRYSASTEYDSLGRAVAHVDERGVRHELEYFESPGLHSPWSGTGRYAVLLPAQAAQLEWPAD